MLVAAAVADEEALACDHPAVQRQILAVVSNIVALAGVPPLCLGLLLFLCMQRSAPHMRDASQLVACDHQ